MAYGDEFEYWDIPTPVTQKKKISNEIRRSRIRPTTDKINKLQTDPKNFEIEMTADNAVLPVPYGEVILPGMISGVWTTGSFIYYRVVWCIGEIYQIDAMYVNGEEFSEYDSSGDDRVHHYRGATYQTPDAWIQEADPSYAENLVLARPYGLIGVSYSVVKVAVADVAMFGGAPRFQAKVRGVLVYEPSIATVADITGYDDPFIETDTGFALIFTGSNGSTPADVDYANYSTTITWGNNASIQSNQASFDGNGDYVILSNASATRPNTTKWTMEIKFTPTSVTSTGIRYIVTRGDVGTNRALQIWHVDDDLFMNLSLDGATWDVTSQSIGNNALAAGVESTLVIEYTGTDFYVWLDGEEVWRGADKNNIYNTTGNWQLGRYNGAAALNHFNGTIRSFRLTRNLNRYGGCHDSSGIPFIDSSASKRGYIYDDLACLCFAELALNKFYGLGVTRVNKLASAISWNETEIDTGISRARISYVMADVRRTDEYLDLFAAHAECGWHFDEDSVTLQPDRINNAENPTGWSMYENDQFLTDATVEWTLGSNWAWNSTFGLILHSTVSENTATQAISKTFEAGTTYVATLTLALNFGGAFSAGLYIDGVPIIEDQSAEGTYTYEWVSDGSETGKDIQVVASGNIGVTEASIRRKTWKDKGANLDSLTISGESDSNTPNKVLFNYTEKDANSPNWPVRVYAEAELSGVSDGALPLIDTTIQMLGVFNLAEVALKSFSKLYRLQDRIRYSWITQDRGVVYQTGSVVELDDAQYGLYIKAVVEDVRLMSPGRYLVNAFKYSDLHYPSDIEVPVELVGYVPVGAIAMLVGDSIPAGWVAFSGSAAADGKFIMLTDGTGHSVGDTGGSATVASSGNTSDNGSHGPNEDTYPVESYLGTNENGDGWRYTALDNTNPAHNHTLTIPATDPNVLRRENRLVQKSTATSTTVPKEVMVFGLAGLVIPDVSRNLSYNGRMLMCDQVSSQNAGQSSKSVYVTSGNTDDSHVHYSRTFVTNGSPESIDFGTQNYFPNTGGGLHNHIFPFINLIHNIKRIGFPLYNGSKDYAVVQGVIFLWAGSLTSMPTGFSLCNGKLGTPDVEDRFVQLAGTGGEFTKSGNNTVRFTGTSYSVAHNHRGTYSSILTYATLPLSHENDVEHFHEYDETENWTAPYYVLAAIMYNPKPVTSWVDLGLLLSAGEGADATTTIVDNSPLGLSSSSQGNIEWDDAQQLFGKNTIKFKTTAARLAYDTGFDYGDATKRFTFEGFCRVDGANEQADMLLAGNHAAADATTDRWWLKWNSTTNLVELYVNNALVASSSTIGVDVWFYVAVCYTDDGKFQAWAGTQSSGAAGRFADHSHALTSHAGKLWLGNNDTDSGGSFRGWMGEICVTRDAAIYDASAIAIPTGSFATS